VLDGCDSDCVEIASSFGISGRVLLLVLLVLMLLLLLLVGGTTVPLIVSLSSYASRVTPARFYAPERLTVVCQRPVVSDFLGHESVEQRDELPMSHSELLRAMAIKEGAVSCAGANFLPCFE